MALTGNLRKWLLDRFDQRIRFDEPMAAHTSLRVGGPAEAFAMPLDIDELAALLGRLRQEEVPYWVVGDGTNLLVGDQGLPGVVITLAPQFNAIAVEEESGEAATVRAMAGAKLNRLCRFAIEKGLKGLNFALGIPGTVGGALAMNAGTRLGAMANVLTSIKVLGHGEKIHTVVRRDLDMSYRQTQLPQKVARGGTAVILEGRFVLTRGDSESLRDEADHILRQRKGAQPTSKPSAGCFFRNPSPDRPAGLLIDEAGMKGECIGGAQVSERHANFIINAGGATAGDILELAARIQERVMTLFKVRLEPEVVFLGTGNHG